jgi:hypothetical protein
VDVAPPATTRPDRRLARGSLAGRSTRSRDARPVPSAVPYGPHLAWNIVSRRRENGDGERTVSHLAFVRVKMARDGPDGASSRSRLRRSPMAVSPTPP